MGKLFVIDGTDGNDYYIPLSDSTNLLSLGSVISSNEIGNK